MNIILTENQFKNFIARTYNNVTRGADDYLRGFKINDEEPTDYKGVFARCGYEIAKEATSSDGITVVLAKQMTGPGLEFNGDQPNEVVDALERALGKGAKFCGQLKKAPWIFKFVVW